MSGHVVQKKLYFVIFGSLLALTALTTGMAYVDMGKGNTVVALAIAAARHRWLSYSSCIGAGAHAWYALLFFQLSSGWPS